MTATLTDADTETAAVTSTDDDIETATVTPPAATTAAPTAAHAPTDEDTGSSPLGGFASPATVVPLLLVSLLLRLLALARRRGEE